MWQLAFGRGGVARGGCEDARGGCEDAGSAPDARVAHAVMELEPETAPHHARVSDRTEERQLVLGDGACKRVGWPRVDGQVEWRARQRDATRA